MSTEDSKTPWLRYAALAAAPILVGVAVSIPEIPGTGISLAVPFAAEGPGPTFDTLGEVNGEPVVEILGTDSHQTDGQLRMTTVSVRSNMTFVQALNRWLVHGDTLVPIDHVFPSDMTEEEIQERNKISFTNSETAATLAAMNYLDAPSEAVVVEALEGSVAAGLLLEGDVIEAIDGVEMATPNDVATYIQQQPAGEEVHLRLRREAQTEELRVTLGESEGGFGQLGVLLTAQPADGISVEYNLQDVGGSSAGMIFSLAVIDKLSDGALNYGNHVAGTGTIDPAGNVGPIGGISHKINASADVGAQLFLAPAANCSEAMEADRGDMQIASVRNLNDAIKAMEAFNAGEEFPTCH